MRWATTAWGYSAPIPAVVADGGRGSSGRAGGVLPARGAERWSGRHSTARPRAILWIEQGW
eukprot:gene36175-32547_t